MIKLITLPFLCLILFVACASHSNPNLLQQELNQFATFENEANIEIESLNRDMVHIIEEHKSTNNSDIYNSKVKEIKSRIKSFTANLAALSSNFKHPSIKEYSKIIIERLEVESKISSDIYSQYIEGGEFNRKDNPKERHKELVKLKKIKNKENNIIAKIKEELSQSK